MNTNEQREFLAKSIVINILITVLVVTSLLHWFPLNEPELTHTDQAYQVESTQRNNIEDIIETVNPAVVSIVITKDVPIIEQYFEDYDPFGFGGMFGFQIPRYRENGTEEQEVGGGSGFIVSENGLVVTNKHVIEDEEAKYTLFMIDGTRYEADVLAKDPLLDIAVLKIQGNIHDLPYLKFGDSSSLRLGQTVIAIGNALAEFRNSVSVGVVSGLSRSITAGSYSSGVTETLDEVIQTDAAINPGNSGGPLLNTSGEVIGVNVAVAAGSENIGFSLPGNMAQSIVESVQQYGEIVRPYLGIRYVQVTPSMQEKNNLKYDYGVLIVRGENKDELAVIPSGPADKAGLRENDIILKVDGQKLDSKTNLSQLIRKKSVGDTLKLQVYSEGVLKDLSLQLEKFPE